MIRHYKFIRLKWGKPSDMSEALFDELERLDREESAEASDLPYEVVQMSAVDDEILLLVAQDVP